MKNEEIKRLFFGFEVKAPWPEELPQGRLLQEKCRHITVAFLGNVPYLSLQEILPSMPLPSYKVGVVGSFDECLFLPERHPHVAAWHVRWFEDISPLVDYQRQLASWLGEHGYKIDQRDFLPHVTIARSPFNMSEWKGAFSPLPMMVTNLNLYESTGGLHYEPRWTHTVRPPFIEMDHTADVAYLVQGESLQQLHLHARTALAFQHPGLLEYFSPVNKITSLDEIVVDLNGIVAKADSAVGCPFKAVSYHGNAKADEEGVLQWEMIIDV